MSVSKKKPIPTVMIALCALFAALLAVSAWISVPVSSGIPFTLQLLAVMLCASLLPPMYAVLSVVAYELLGVVGLPVFSQFGSGVGVLFGVKGGYLIGFIPAAWIAGMLIHHWGREIWKQVIAMVLGIVVCYIFGSVWFAVSLKRTFMDALTTCVIPYLLFDAVKIALAVILSKLLYQPLAQVLRRSQTR